MIHELLRGKQVILASASPRRQEIFRFLGIKALQMPADIPEDPLPITPRKLVQFHALSKAETIRPRVDPDCLIVAADTLVYHNRQILGKPADAFQAAEYLTRLSDSFHYVYTGLSLAYQHRCLTSYTKSRVEFYRLTAAEIESYLKTGEPLDKAGAYGIQGYGSQFIKSIHGCYFNVMGFPVSLFYLMLKDLMENKR